LIHLESCLKEQHQQSTTRSPHRMRLHYQGKQWEKPKILPLPLSDPFEQQVSARVHSSKDAAPWIEFWSDWMVSTNALEASHLQYSYQAPLQCRIFLLHQLIRKNNRSSLIISGSNNKKFISYRTKDIIIQNM
jgi:hypothetical protein